MAEAEVLSSKVARHEVDFAIITAIEIEAKAVVSRLKDHTVKRFEDKDIRTYHCGTVPIPGTDQRYRVVVITLPSMGTISAANAVTDTIVHWNPRYVLMVGIAGGIPQDDLDLGDVLVAEQVVGYDYGKVTDQGIKPRDHVYPASALLLDRIRNFWDSAWTQQVNVARPANTKRAVPKRFVGLIASGNRVIASAEFREQLTRRWPKLLAVETESEGVFAAVFDRPNIRGTLVIRGISDMADECKSDAWQEYAANAAAAFVENFLKNRPVEPRTQAGDKGEQITLPRLSPGSNPFIYGRPVQPGEFVDREDELRAVFNRLRHGESTAIVGEPHIGKTSLLLQLADEKTQLRYLGDSVQRLTFSNLNLQSVSSDFSPTAFWEKALGPLRELSRQEGIAWRLEQLARADYPGDSLEELFGYLHRHGRQLVLLLDEFELLLCHPNFQEFSFYATLRAIAAFPSFSLVLASRPALGELEEQAHKLPVSGGSPVFNYLIEVRLLPFDEKGVNALLNQAGDALSSDDRLFIRFMAGRHPYLVQAMAAAQWETTGEARYARAAELYYGQTCRHFDDLWRTLDDHTRTTVVVLGLVELGRCKLGDGFEYNEIQDLGNLGARLRDLAKLGLAERVSADWLSNTGCLLWREEWWTLEAQAFTCWIYDVTIAETRRVSAYDEWLSNEGYRSLLRREQWDRLLNAVHSAVGRKICDIGTMAESMFKELARRRENGSAC